MKALIIEASLPIFLSTIGERCELLWVTLGWGGGRAMCCSTETAGVRGTERSFEKAVRMSQSHDQLPMQFVTHVLATCRITPTKRFTTLEQGASLKC